MTTSQHDDPHDTMFRRMKPTIDRDYPHGWFVAIADDRVIAADANFHALESKLREQGIDPRNTLVAEAGVEYPETVTILVADRA